MKKVLLTILIILFTQFSIAQKVKVKKGEIFIDKVKVGNIEKLKTEKPKYYQLTNNEGTPLFKIKTISQESFLYHTDKVYDFHIITGNLITDTIAIDQKNFYLSDGKIVNYLVKIGIFDTNGFNSENATQLLENPAKKPTWIAKRLKEEQEIVKNIEYKVERESTYEDIFIKPYATKNGISKLNKSMVDMTKFDVYERHEEGTILIGYAISQFNTISKLHYLFMFNLKDVPLASYNGATYKVYKPYKEFGLTESSLKMSSQAGPNAKRMAIDLVKKGKL